MLSSYLASGVCRDCHIGLPFAKLDRECGTCHDDWTRDNFNHAVTGQRLDENHRDNDCADCHADQKYAVPPTCDNCHDEDDDPRIRFPSQRPGPGRAG